MRVTDDLALSPDALSLYHASDPLLGHLPVLIFHGPSTTANYTLNSSRIQIHILSPAGFRSFPRIPISPSSPFYSVVNFLPREIQVDEVYRGLAFGLFKYFSELPDGVKKYLRNLYPTRGVRPGSDSMLFGERHAADLVEVMVKSENTAEVIAAVQDALQTQHVNNVDVDLVLPPGAIIPLQPADSDHVPENEDDILDPTLRQYGGYTPLVKLLGEPVFLPTSKLRRAPSKPTSVNRARTFTRDQKRQLRMKLEELVDTEERYVMKLRELVHHVAKDFRQHSRARSEASLSPSEQELERLFPASADQILELNSQFMQQLRKIMDETQEEALMDMDKVGANISGFNGSGPARSRDPSGALGMAKLFHEWFPRFTKSYQNYIRASQHFSTLLNTFLDQQSSFRQRVMQTGEQTIRSILIEPVQRLPRYSLLIDQIVNSLPITHPALQPMLKARDIITNICSMDDPLTDGTHAAHRLRNMVESWPLHLEPEGRLLVAADFVELAPPFQSADELNNSGLLLLFADCVVILKKNGSNMTGRDLLREFDKPSAAELLISMTNAAGGAASYEFAFAGWHDLADLRFTESADGSLVWMTSTKDLRDANLGSSFKASKGATSRCFLLQEAFQGRASKLSEDIVKARIEARFSEAEREDPCWTLRSVRIQDNNLGLHVAVFQEGADQLIEGRKDPAPIRVVVDHEKGTKGAPLGHYGVEIVINLSSNHLKRISMLTTGLHGKQFHDEIELEDLIPTMSRRLIQLLSSQFHVRNTQLTAPMISYYTKTLRGLSFSASRTEKTRSFLTASPVKLFSSLWNGGSNANNPDVAVSGTKTQQPPSLHRANSFHSMFGSIRGKDSRPNTADGKPENPLLRLEQTFTGFVAALQSRKGFVIGRSLLNRSLVDELAVNDLYNRFIENPLDYRVASDVGTEVVFVAYEKFLHIAWAEQMGPVMTTQAMDTLLERANKRVPGDFADFVNYLLKDMAPQNRRAFISLIKLLADLLDGCGNDSDRGALTLAFAELLVTSGAAHNYINLLDRLVQDCDRMFDDQNASQGFHPTVTGFDSCALAYRPGKAHTGSITSNASSLRRKFGLDSILRQGSKDERPSMWRTLSKHRNPATGEASTLTSDMLDVNRPVDDNSLPRRKHRRAMSRDRPHLGGAFDELPERPSSSHRLDFPLDTIGEPCSPERALSKSWKKKRRSSLSDLKSLMAAVTLEDASYQPLQATKPTSGKVNNTGPPASPKPALLSKIPVNPSVAEALKNTRQREKEREKEKENSSSPLKAAAGTADQAATPNGPGTPSRLPRHSKSHSVSAIPVLRPAKSASSVEPAIRSGSPTRSNAQRLRMHSPQKLRERLQSEKQIAQEVDSSLQSELTKIGEEMAWVDPCPPTTPSIPTTQTGGFATSLQELEDKIQVMMRELHAKHATTQHELDITLRNTEAKVRAIDQLHKEVVAENELLYEKYNGELGRIIKAIKGKSREDKEDLVAKLKEQGEETARLKRENARLKREVVGLRAMLKGGE